jgi:hypothetical protein
VSTFGTMLWITCASIGWCGAVLPRGTYAWRRRRRHRCRRRGHDHTETCLPEAVRKPLRYLLVHASTLDDLYDLIRFGTGTAGTTCNPIIQPTQITQVYSSCTSARVQGKYTSRMKCCHVSLLPARTNTTRCGGHEDGANMPKPSRGLSEVVTEVSLVCV